MNNQSHRVAATPEQTILSFLQREARTPLEIAQHTPLTLPEVLRILPKMVAQGSVRKQGAWYSLVPQGGRGPDAK